MHSESGCAAARESRGLLGKLGLPFETFTGRSLSPLSRVTLQRDECLFSAHHSAALNSSPHVPTRSQERSHPRAFTKIRL